MHVKRSSQGKLDANGALFPNKQALSIFFGYIGLFVSSTLLISYAQRQQHLKYNQILLVSLVELVKLLLCSTIYVARDNGSPRSLLNDLIKNRRLFILYLIPAFLYCMYNNLTFINLQLFDPTTYHCLMQFRIVLTAFIYQVLFRRRLTKSQWLSLGVLTIGCLIIQFGIFNREFNHKDAIKQEPEIIEDHSEDITEHYTTLPMNANVIQKAPQVFVKIFFLISLILLQMFCSCFAGVYNEYLLKDNSSALTTDIILQNIYMYLDSILCNAIVYMCVHPASLSRASKGAETINGDNNSLISNLSTILTNPLLTLIILILAISGLVASIFLKKLNSILKTFASAIEVFAVAFLAWILFADSIDRYTILAILLVSLALIVYARDPVSVAPPDRRPNQSDGFHLIADDPDDDESSEVDSYPNHDDDNNSVTIVVK